MIGKEPEVFTGDRDKVEEFMTSWSVYQGINKQTRVMNNPMSRTMLFFGYLRGPKMHLWIKKISAQLDRHCNSSISVESESCDFCPDPDRLVIVRCLALASCPLPFSLVLTPFVTL